MLHRRRLTDGVPWGDLLKGATCRVEKGGSIGGMCRPQHERRVIVAEPRRLLAREVIAHGFRLIGEIRFGNVADDPDHALLRTVAAAHDPADRILAREILLRERLVDDDRHLRTHRIRRLPITYV